MSKGIVALDPLLYYMHEQGSGSWEQFARAVRDFNQEANEFVVARGLSEHALVEFLWDSNKSWSVTNAVAVLANRRNGRFALWGGTHRASKRLEEVGICSQIEDRWIVRGELRYSYRHVVAMDTSNISLLRKVVPVINSSDIVQRLPSVDALLRKIPHCEPPSSNASTCKWSYRFGAGWWDESISFTLENPSLWRVGRSRYFFVHDGIIRQVPEWLGKWLLYATERTETYAATYVKEGEVFALPFAPQIPPLYVRAMLFSGALETAPAQFGTRCFLNVEELLALSICNKLSIEPEIHPRRPREVA